MEKVSKMEITRLEPAEKKGLIVVITGHGKGKTTTALGITVRACGHDMSTSIIQFMKGDISRSFFRNSGSERNPDSLRTVPPSANGVVTGNSDER